MAERLTLTSIQHRYGPDVTLTYPELSLEGGAELVFSGPSGVGKTTWLHFIAGLLVDECHNQTLPPVETHSKSCEPLRRPGHVSRRNDSRP